MDALTPREAALAVENARLRKIMADAGLIVEETAGSVVAVPDAVIPAFDFGNRERRSTVLLKPRTDEQAASSRLVQSLKLPDRFRPDFQPFGCAAAMIGLTSKRYVKEIDVCI